MALCSFRSLGPPAVKGNIESKEQPLTILEPFFGGNFTVFTYISLSPHAVSASVQWSKNKAGHRVLSHVLEVYAQMSPDN